MERMLHGRGLARGEAEARLNSLAQAEYLLDKAFSGIPNRIVVDTSGPAERINGAAIRILDMVKRWR